MSAEDRHQVSHNWQEVVEHGDEEAFQAVVRPHTDALLEAARRDLAYYEAQGVLHEDDLTPEEVTGEAMLHAWHHRERRPEKMSLRGWLLGTQYRVLRGLVEDIRQYRADKAISLDDYIPVQSDQFDRKAWFYEWYRPDEAGTLWEEIIPEYDPVDFEIDLADVDHARLLNPASYHVLMLHDEFDMDLPEVAFAMAQSVDETARALNQARVMLRERLFDGDAGEDDNGPAVDPPAPPAGSDE